jgi:hypothetical protein
MLREDVSSAHLAKVAHKGGLRFEELRFEVVYGGGTL